MAERYSDEDKARFNQMAAADPQIQAYIRQTPGRVIAGQGRFTYRPSWLPKDLVLQITPRGAAVAEPQTTGEELLNWQKNPAVIGLEAGMGGLILGPMLAGGGAGTSGASGAAANAGGATATGASGAAGIPTIASTTYGTGLGTMPVTAGAGVGAGVAGGSGAGGIAGTGLGWRDLAKFGMQGLASWQGSRAANNAAQQQVDAANRALEFAKQVYDEQRANQAPFIGVGHGSANTLAHLMGLSPQPPMAGGPLSSLGGQR